MPPRKRAGKGGGSASKTKGTSKSEQHADADTADHGADGSRPSMAEAETHGCPPEGDKKAGLQVIVLVRN